MKFKRILTIAGAIAVLAGPALAQQAVVTSPASRVTTNASSTIAVTDTFQQIWATQTNRVNCGIQNNSTGTMWVWTGPAGGTPTKATSVVLAPGTYLNCATSGVVVASAVWITGTAGGEFYAGLDGAPVISAPSTVSGGGGTIIPLPSTGAVTTTGASVGVASAAALAAGDRDYLLLNNASASAFVACNFGGAAVINGAGSITMSPYQSYVWESSFVPNDAINCIASAAATPLTILSSAQ